MYRECGILTSQRAFIIAHVLRLIVSIKAVTIGHNKSVYTVLLIAYISITSYIEDIIRLSQRV